MRMFVQADAKIGGVGPEWLVTQLFEVLRDSGTGVCEIKTC